MSESELTGGCRCGAVRYAIAPGFERHAVCHCRDCQLAHGAPLVGWIAVKAGNFTVTAGEPASYLADSGSRRDFCATCGTPLFFVNEAMLPGIVDVASVTLDRPDIVPPLAQVQVAERRAWMAHLADAPEFERFPG